MLHWVDGQFDLKQENLFGPDFFKFSYTWLLFSLEVHRQDMDFVEFFAGTANTTRCMRYANYRSVKFDLLYYEPPKKGLPSGKSKKSKKSKKEGFKTNFMDILTPAGFLFLEMI